MARTFHDNAIREWSIDVNCCVLLASFASKPRRIC